MKREISVGSKRNSVKTFIFKHKRTIVIVFLLLAIMFLNGINYIHSTQAVETDTLSFNELTEDDYITASDNVQFAAYFKSGDTKLDGTSNRIGYSDTLYFDLIVTDGELKDASITINSENFYFETNLLSDSLISGNYISNNTSLIELNDMSGSFSRTIEGSIKSGDYNYITSTTAAIGNDSSNYTKENTVVFKAIYDDGNGNKIKIEKTVTLTVDWYGEINCEIPDEVYGQDNLVQKYNILDYIDTDSGELTIEFIIATQETKNEVLINGSYIEGTIPSINGYDPTSVVIEGENVEDSYSKETKVFTAYREAVISNNTVTEQAYSGTYAENGINYRYNEYVVKVTYPIEAYTDDEDEYISIDIPVTAYYEGVNGEKSSEVTATINVSYLDIDNLDTGMSVSVGRSVLYPVERQVVSKENILLGYMYSNSDDIDIESTYYTKWNIVTSEGQTVTSATLSDGNEEDRFITSDGSIEENNGYITNKGIAFSNPISALGADGWIEVYDVENDTLIHKFTAEDWNDYDILNPYEYEEDVKYIKIVTSEISENSFMIIYNIKEFNISKIVQDFKEDYIYDLKYIESTFSGSLTLDDGSELNYSTNSATANFEEEISIINFDVNKDELNTQTSNNIQIEISPNMSQYNSSTWQNEEYLIKFPSDVISVEINSITTNNNIDIENYYTYTEDGYTFIKIEMGKNSISNYSLLLNLNVSLNLLADNTTELIELYAYNDNNNSFYETERAQDIYDVNNNSDKEEIVGYKSYSINIVTPETLVTTQYATNVSDEDVTIYAPLTSYIDNEDRTATVNMLFKNNTDNNITDIKVLGTIPYKGNEYLLTGDELGSTYTAELTEDGIELPDELASYATIYYSEKEEVNDDITEVSNGWTTEVTDYSSIKHFLIVFNRYELKPDETVTITYNIKVPEEINYNEVAYSTHIVYFSQTTGDDTTRESVEVQKLGFMICKTVNFELTTNSLEDNSPIEGVTYKLTELGDRETTTILISDAEGKISFSDLLLEKTYKLEQIGISDDYVLNEDEIEFMVYEEDNEINIKILSSNTDSFADEININQRTATISSYLYNEIKFDLQITNLNTDGEGIVSTFTLESEEETIEYSTDENGNLVIEGLYLDVEYTLTQTYSKGYYLDETEVKFTITRGENGLEIVSDTEGFSLNKSDDKIKPTVLIEYTNEEIPSYSLTVTLYEEDTSIALEDAEYIITGGGKESGETYTTDSSGSFTIEGLYSYVDGKNVTGEYVLKQTSAATGYRLSANDITFYVEMDTDTQELTLVVESGEIREEYTINGNNVSIGLDASKIFNITTIDGETTDLLPGVTVIIKELVITDDVEVEQDPVDDFGNPLGTEIEIDGVVYKSFVTNADGIIEEELRDGIYKIVVIAVPEGYVLEENEEDRTYYVGIGTTRGASVEVSFEDPVILGEVGDVSYPSEYYVAGREDGTGLYYHRGTLHLIDASLNVIATDSSNDVNQILVNDDGNWVVLEDSRIVIYDDSLTELETIYIPNSLGAGFFAMTSDGGYVITGSFSGTLSIAGDYTSEGEAITITSTMRGSSYTTDTYVMKIDSLGKIENIVNVGGTGTDIPTFITVTSDGKFVVSAHFASTTTISGTMMSDGMNETGTFTDCYFVMDDKTMLINYIVSVGTERGNVKESAGNVHRAFASQDGSIYYVGQMEGTITFSGDQTESGNEIVVTSSGETDAYIVKFNSEGKVVWAIAVGGANIEHIYSAEFVEGEGIILGGDSKGGNIVVDGSQTSDGISITSTPVGTNASNWRGIALKVDTSGKVVWVNEFGYSSNEGIYAFAGFTGNSYVICGFETIDGIQEFTYIRVTEAVTRSEISAVEGIEIPEIKEKFTITTSVSGGEGTITGQDEEILEEVTYGENSKNDIEIKPSEGFEILSITINGKKITFTPDEYGNVTLPRFEYVTEDIDIVVEFSNEVSRVTVHHYLYDSDADEPTKVSEDEILVGIIGDEYTTSPAIGLTGYTLATDNDGNYRIDGDPSGTFEKRRFSSNILLY